VPRSKALRDGIINFPFAFLDIKVLILVLVKILIGRRPLDDLFLNSHSVEFALRSNCVGSHSSHNDPISDFHFGDSHFVSNDIVSVASLSKDTSFTKKEISGIFGCEMVFSRVELVLVILKGESVHKNDVHAVVKSVVHMVAKFTVFLSFSDNSHS